MLTTLARWLMLTGVATSMYGQLSSDQLAEHAKAAQEAQARQDFKTAITEYEILARALPRNAELLSNLGVAYYSDQQFQKCSTVFRKAIALKPGLETPHLFLGLAMYHLSNYDGAIIELQEARHLSPSDALAHTWLGYAYTAQSHYNLALPEFQAASRLQPDNVDVWYALGQTYLEIGKEKTQTLLHIASDGWRVWQLAAEQFELQGNHQKAVDAMQEARHRKPDLPTPEESSPQDTLYAEARDAEQASHEAFQHVIQIDPDSARAHQIAAEALFIQQQFDGALAEYGKVLKTDPSLPGVHLQISNILMIRGKFGEALEECRAEEKLQPFSSQVQTSLGRILLALGRDSEAASTLEHAMNLNKPPAEANLLLAKVYLRNNREPEAIPLLERYIAARPESSNGYYLLSRAYRAAGNREKTEQALVLYQKTSQDVKERNMAQAELSHLGNERASEQINEMDDDNDETYIHPKNTIGK